ncbi:hypothetical protein COCNU_06G012360 [Cocos nucifera]|uniref:Uncharacterized protein n=1 Tax=Cocos nucifera TaxID=13894 RepID=A0A8K0N3U1_COCNU|nr:hypothetical protein COCNU_06G012350 [Cocos nucifera]KAG1347407.1 hypothetical protein COCNU_06G012360 [Cocos nucifera]
MEVPPSAGARDNKSGLDDYWIARSLIQSILLPADVKTMDCKGGAFRLAHHLDHFSDMIRKAWCISKEAEEKVYQANRRANDVELSKLKAEEELKKETKRFNSELPKARSDFKVWLNIEKKKFEEKLEASKIATIKAFKSSKELRNIKLEFGSLSYLQGAKDLKVKLKRILLGFNLGLLKSDCEEEVAEGRDGEIRMEDLFSPT